jgi:hypothetical protein
MIAWLRALYSHIRRRRLQKQHDAIVQQYREFGTAFGDSLSYAYLGNRQICHRSKVYTYQEALDILDQLESAYAALGYRIISLDDWTDHGGYDKDIDRMWLCKRQSGEKPLYTKDLINKI